MKNKFCVYYLLLCLTLGSVFCPQKAYADGEILALKPSSLEVNLGDNLEIIIHISNASNLASLATDITYNPELLQFNPDLSTYVGIFNDPTAFSLPIEEMVSGNGDIMLYADIFESVMSGGDAINGDVDLAILSFTAINTGIDNLEFSGLFITDDMSTELIPLSQEGAAVTIIAPYVPDVISPVITLNGSSTIDLIVGEEYVEYGANAIDDIDGDISSNIIVTGTFWLKSELFLTKIRIANFDASPRRRSLRSLFRKKVFFAIFYFARPRFFLLKGKENFFAGLCSERAGRRGFASARARRNSPHTPLPPRPRLGWPFFRRNLRACQFHWRAASKF